jgi:hypothetical protein
MKTCSLCGLEKLLSEFYKNCKAKDGLTSRCKACAQLASEDSRVKNPGRVKAYHQNRSDTRRESEYLGKPPENLARAMAVIIKVVKHWRDHDPAKFTEFKNQFKERAA